MSAGRKSRRANARWIVRRPGVEPSAETRVWVARMIAAHDDDAVSLEQYMALGRQWADYMVGLPEAERVEAACMVSDHAGRALTGQRLRTVAIERREAS